MSIISGNLEIIVISFQAVGIGVPCYRRAIHPSPQGLSLCKNNSIFVGGNLGYSNITLGNFQGGLVWMYKISRVIPDYLDV